LLFFAVINAGIAGFFAVYREVMATSDRGAMGFGWVGKSR